VTGPASSDEQQEPLPADEALARLARMLLAPVPLPSALQQVADLAARAVPGAAEVSVTLVEDGQPGTAVFTGPVAVALDERQYAKGFGPCLDAATYGQTIVTDSTDDRTPYRDFREACRGAGVTQTLSAGLPVAHRVSGGLNLYAITGQPLDPATVQLAETVAGYAAAALARTLAAAPTEGAADQLRAAMAARVLVEQAKGVLMAREQCSQQQALGRLTELSEEAGRTLREVAGDVVASIQA
jgi:GAF domain-containing protein